MRPTTPRVWFVVPDGIDDPTRPSGGNIYDRRVRDGLVGLGWEVKELGVPGSWPNPAAEDLARLRALLAGVPDHAVALVDGLVGSAATEVLLPEAVRLRLVPLVHMPLHSDGERKLLEASYAVVTTSHWTRRWLLDTYGLPEGLLQVAEPGVDMADPVTGTEGGGELICIAAVTPGKGHGVLVTALAELRDLDWRLSLVGPLDRDPDFVETLRRQVLDADLADRVRFAGSCSHEEVAKSCVEADVLVLASRAETYGMVVTEALAHGLPVIATTVGGVPETLGRAEDGSIPGLLVRPDDPDALALALRRWLGDPLRRRRLRRAAGLRRLTLSGWSRTSAQVSVALSSRVEAAR